MAETAARTRKPRIREVDVPDAPIRMVWADPVSLDKNGWNFKVHTDYQTEVVSELIRKHGWIKPLVYNLASGKLIDGHDRREIAVARGMPAVPVVVGTWPEEQEPEILGALDASGALAKVDPQGIRRILDELGDPSPVIDRLITDMAESAGALRELTEVQPARVEPEFTPDPIIAGGNGEAAEPGAYGQPAASPTPHDTPPIPHYQPEPSTVKMVQLYLDTETFPEFRKMVHALQDEHGTDTETDTVMAVLREAYREAVGADD